jgi:hypothetical protein
MAFAAAARVIVVAAPFPVAPDANAIDALPEAGGITVKLSVRPEPERVTVAAVDHSRHCPSYVD